MLGNQKTNSTKIESPLTLIQNQIELISEIERMNLFRATERQTIKNGYKILLSDETTKVLTEQAIYLSSLDKIFSIDSALFLTEINQRLKNPRIITQFFPMVAEVIDKKTEYMKKYKNEEPDIEPQSRGR